VVSGGTDIHWERKAFAKMMVGDGQWRAQEMPVFGVVAVAVGSLGIGILVAALGLALGNMGGIIVWNGLEVLQFGKARA